MPFEFGVILATISLGIGLFFFVFYAARYYIFSATVLFLSILGRNGHNGNGHNGNGNGRENGNPRGRLLRWALTARNGNGNHGNGNHGNGSANGKSNYLAKFGEELTVEPFVSIHLPLFNEPNVAERLLTACTTLDYRNYEVIVIDDSTDETTGILQRWVQSNNVAPTLPDGGVQAQVQVVETLLSLRIPVKIIHRNNRSGFKGGALNEALKYMNPKAEYVIIFDADFIPPPDIIRRFLAYFATCSPSAAVKAVLKLDKEYADGKITLDTYLTERLNLSTKLVKDGVAMESLQLANHSLFELDQLFAKGAIDQEEYLVRRKAIMRELSKSPWTSPPPENKLALKQAFTICKLFSEDKIDATDFKARMRTISSASSERSIARTGEAPVFVQILELDQQLAKGAIDINTYGKKRTNLAAQLLALTENSDELKSKFELDQQLAKAKITFDEYLEKRNGRSVPPSRIVHLSAKTINGGNGNGNGHNSGNGNGFVAVQGYQLHYLNRSENWLTQGIRAEFSGSYMIERTCEEILGAMKMIAGSVYMIKADAVRKFGWSESLTEDWELTCRLYRDGKKVIYTPTIQAPAECPSTLKRVIRQRQRWAEGHTYNAKRYFWSILKSPNLTIREKLEFAYFAPYYLQSVFFIVGTFLWLTSEYLHQYPPFWTPTFGWALLLSNMMALPLMNLAGLLGEGTAKKDLTGIFSAIVLSYILSIFQAQAALKGLIGKQEGTWIRTYKTGLITETVRRFQIGKFWRSITKPKPKSTKSKTTRSKEASNPTIRSRMKFLGPRGRASAGVVIVALLTALIAANVLLAPNIQTVKALPGNTSWYPNAPASFPGTLTTGAPATGTVTIDNSGSQTWSTSPTQYWVGGGDAVSGWFFHLYCSAMSTGTFSFQVEVYYSASSTGGTRLQSGSISSKSLTCDGSTDNSISLTPDTWTGTPGMYFINLKLFTSSNQKTVTMNVGSGKSYLTDGTSVPEYALFLALLAPLIPTRVRNTLFRRRRE